MVDFSKLLEEDPSLALVNPVEIIRALPRANTKYDYLRDVQGEVLKLWHERRTERETVCLLVAFVAWGRWRIAPLRHR